MTFDGSEKMTIGVSLLRRVSPLLFCSSFIVIGSLFIVFSEALSRTRGKFPAWFFVIYGIITSVSAIYIFYKFLKILGPNTPSLELNSKGISIFYSAIKFEQYEWKEIEVFSSAKRPSFFGLNNDCVVVKLKDAPNGVNCVEIPAGLDQGAPRLADFLNSQRLKFDSKQNQENG